MKFSKEIMKGAAEVIVLKTLDDLSEAYGYQLIKAIAQTSNNVFEFQEGTLYPLLYRLEDKGYVQSEKKPAESGKMRRYYSLTTKGAAILQERTAEYGAFIAGLNNVLKLTT